MIRAATDSVTETHRLAAVVAAELSPGDVIVLAGDLGSGKTAFAQGLARGLGVIETVTSPAFVLVRNYEGRLPLAHLDVYRLDHLSELADLGLAELVDGDGVTVIEWGDVVAAALPYDFLEIRLAMTDEADAESDGADEHRLITLRPVGPAWASRLAGIRESLSEWVAGP